MVFLSGTFYAIEQLPEPFDVLPYTILFFT